ncbi:MAG TPA: DoxX family protein [Candidatus Polarisedimenticolia bacterium]|nr:DoxX family protein [Candidatus Polarisedimenticolia bacterium]
MGEPNADSRPASSAGPPAPWLPAVSGHLARCVLGLIFLASGVLKAVDPAEFARQMAGYGILGAGPSALAAPLLIAFETTLGVALLAGLRPRGAALVAAVLLVGFIGVETYGLSTGRTESCGCFGGYVERTPAQVIGEDLVFLALAALVLWGLRGRAARPERGAVVVVACGAALALAFTFASPRLPIDRYVTRLGEGRTLADLGLAGKVPGLDQGRHLVALLDLADPGAVDVAARLKEIADLPGTPAIVAFTASTDEERGAFLWAAVPAFDIHGLDRAVIKRLYRRLPRFFLLEEGRVVSVYDGTPPAPSDLISSGAS